MIRGRGLGEAVAIAFLCAITTVAQEYSFRHYGSAEGLQNLVVLSLAQDHAGYIWAGTEDGLYRYDGTRFRLMGQAEGLPCSTEVHGLFVASDGALWANTCTSIFRFDGQRFESIQGIDRLLRGAQVMADAAGGGMLITTSTGLYEASRSADGSFSTHSYLLPPALAGKPMHGILRQGRRVWFGCDQQLCMEQAGQFSMFGREQGLPDDAWDGIQVSPDGSVWVRSPKNIYRRAPGQTRFSQEKPDIASSGFWGALTLGRDGSILVPTDQGLAIHTKAGWSVLNRRRGLSKENTAAVLEDREGSVWIGLAGGGLERWLGRGVWESWKMDQGLPSDIVWNIRRDRKGALWVGTSLGLTRIDSSGRLRNWTKKDGLGSENVRWLAETTDGSIWAAMKPGGLARINPVSGKVRRAGANDGLPCDPEDLFVDQHDRLWIPTVCGLFLNERPSVSNRVIRVETPESFGRAAWKVMEDTQGTVWVANRAALWSLRDGQWRPHRRAEGLLTDNPYSMALASDGSIWVRHRYDAGIDRLEVSGDRIVRATAVVPADPKTTEGTAFHGFDAFGNFWRGTTNGVAVLHSDTWTTFTTEDGLVSNDCDGEAFWADTDGGVWLGTSGGLAHYFPRNGVALGPLIAYPTVARLEINQPARLIRAEFSSLNYKAEQLVRFAYRLDQGPWTDSVERNISITGLGPGSHRLEVRCRVRDGPFSPGIAAAEFRLEPVWRETWWARFLAVACVLAAITQFLRWRLSAATQKKAELEAIIAARTTNLSQANRSLDDKALQLRRSEDRLKNAERLAHLGHWDWDVKANQLSWSEEMFRIFDVPQLYKPSYEGFVQAVIRQDREQLEQWVNECLAKKRGHFIEFQISRTNGDLRIVNCTSEVSLDEQGLPTRLFGACQDITDVKKNEAKLVQAQEDLQALTARLVELQELGMKELARELHDDLSQNLAALGREIETLLRPSAQPSRSLSEQAHEVWRRVTQLARDVHSMSQRLHPAILDDLGLKEALTEQCWAFSERTGIPVQFESAGESTWPAADVSLCFYRVTQEGLHNIAKHAGATNVHLTLSSSEETCTLRIEDNGQGFDLSEAKGKNALGLISMRERARLVNGNFTIRSEYGKGTMLEVSVALKTN